MTGERTPHNVGFFQLSLSLPSFIHLYFYGASSRPLLLGGAPNYSVDAVSELTRRSATGNCYSEGLVQGLYLVARVGFETATFRTQRTEPTAEPPHLTNMSNHRSLRCTTFSSVVVWIQSD